MIVLRCQRPGTSDTGFHERGVAGKIWTSKFLFFIALEFMMSDVKSTDVKADAHRLIDSLPDDATWDDIMYRVYVRQCIDAGIEDADEDRVVDVTEIRRQFGLQP